VASLRSHPLDQQVASAVQLNSYRRWTQAELAGDFASIVLAVVVETGAAAHLHWQGANRQAEQPPSLVVDGPFQGLWAGRFFELGAAGKVG